VLVLITVFSFDTKIGEEAARGHAVTLSSADYMTHLYVVGQTGTGKSTLIENAFQDVVCARAGGLFIDPHGDSFETLLNTIPKERTNDVVLIDLLDEDNPVAFNPIAGVPKSKISRATADVVSSLSHVMDLSPDKTPRIYSYLENSLYALIESGGHSLGDIPTLLEESGFRKQILEGVTHAGVLQFWGQYDKLSGSKKLERTESTLTRLRSLMLHPCMANILCQRKNKIDMRSIIDEQKLVIVNLAKGQVGDNIARLFGGLLIHSVFLAGLARIDTKPYLRRPFYMFADEFPIYGIGSGTLKETLSEIRKYKIGVVLGNQYTGQVDDEVMDAIIGNVGSVVSFRIGDKDAQILHKKLDCSIESLMDLSNHHARVSVLQGGDTGNAYTVKTCPPIKVNHGSAASIKKRSRGRYAHRIS
jgi:type IV secretory pathway TraG/TraD family ATPase VirD4